MTYLELLDQLNALNLALVTMNYDALTIAPRKGAAYRNKSMSLIAGAYFDLFTNSQTHEILVQALQDTNPLIKLSAEYQLKELLKIKNIPHEEYVAFEKLKNDSQQSWEEARNKKNYTLFKDDLDKLIEGQKQMISYTETPLSIYETCLDAYEEGLKEHAVDGFFETLKSELVPFIDTVLQHQGEKPSFLSDYVSDKEQDEISRVIRKHLGYDNSFGYMGHAAHPFNSTFSINDSRITTHYYEHDFTSNIFSIIHEIGHSMYNHQVNPDFEGFPLADNMSMSMHESQSRLLENMIGRSHAFWVPLYPQIQAIIPHVLGTVSLDDFVRGINFVERGCIRVEADELTYPLHIMVRYEVEKAIFKDNHSAEGLDTLFAQKMFDYLGISPADASEGILQDVHWSDASFGYFPTYALGTAYAAQFMNQMEQDINVEEHLINGDLKPIFEWLHKNIHYYGGSIPTQEMIQKVTHEPFNPEYYITYLIEKYSKLLGI